MKPGPTRILPQSLALLAAPLLTLNYASADLVVYNEANANGVWSTVTGTNLLNGATATPAPPVTHEGSSNNWATLTDGIIGTPGTTSGTVTPNNNTTVDFPLDVVAQPAGYDIASFDSWVIWGDSGRTNQNYTLQYSTVGAPTTFTAIATVANGDLSTHKSTHTCITDTNGTPIATGVHTIRLITNTQENGYVGFTELKALAAPTNVSKLVESNNTNSWTLPAGTNLLNGANATPLTTSTQEGSSPNWSTVTNNGQLGTPADISSSVTPPNLTAVTFPLDLSVNTNGYKLSSFDSYCAWPNSGRDNQDYELSYSTVSAPTTFIRIGQVIAHTGGDNSTHVRLTPVSGFLARNVAFVRMSFGYQENGYVGYREFIALGAAEPLVDPLTWTGASGAGGNADWVTAADNNWKKTDGGAPAPYNPLAEVTFDQTGSNRNISVPTALSASVVTLANNGSTSYTFGGQLVTVSNNLISTGTGNVTFNNPMKATSGVTQSGSGSLVFNGSLEGSGLELSGSGSITLNGSNQLLTGSAVVSNGTLTVSHDEGLQSAGVATTGGVVRFTSIAPHINSLSGPFGTSVVLGNTTGPASTFLNIGAPDAGTVTTFEGDISQVAGTASGLTKSGPSTLIFDGVNTYTGPTNVSGGILQFNQRLSLYNGNTAAWTAENLTAGLGGTLALNIGSIDEITEAELNALPLGGFASGSALGIESAEDVVLSRDLTQPGMGLLKTGTGKLTLTGNNTSNGLYNIKGGIVEAASTTGHSIGGSVLFSGAIMDLYLNMAANDQFASGSVLTYNQGNFYNTKLNLRGTSQTIAGLDSAPSPVNLRVVIQNDEIGNPGYTSNPGPASLTIDVPAATSHSFYGLIRNQDGAAVTVVKKGAGTQEFLNSGAQGYGYTGPTNIEAGVLRLNLNGGTSGFGSNITISSGATFELDGTFAFDREIAGAGDVVKKGGGTVTLGNSVNSYTGKTTIDGGVLGMGFSTLADASTVEIAGTAILNLTHVDTDIVGNLLIGGVEQPDGVYGAIGSGAQFETDRITGTGKLQVGGTTEVTYDAWSAIIPTAADRDRTDDPDGDGFTNLMEFLFGTSPIAGNGSLTPIEVTPGGLIIHWNQRATGSSVYVLQESTTLLDSPWPTSGATITNSAVQDVPNYVRKQALIPFTGARKFARVNGTE